MNPYWIKEISVSISAVKEMGSRDAWETRLLSVQVLISGQVMISQLMISSPTSDSVLTAQSLLGILSPRPPLSAPPLLVLAL